MAGIIIYFVIRFGMNLIQGSGYLFSTAILLLINLNVWISTTNVMLSKEQSKQELTRNERILCLCLGITLILLFILGVFYI